ncbi:hypothetical protein [Fusobacterium massiliense]|uniref:hypothetical protein n=1 Tax=Fusobacterium massiliense TaxID=1852365 RepID=UPI0028D47617|nr:hypothetical protein [Fusobacterium massiliense]
MYYYALHLHLTVLVDEAIPPSISPDFICLNESIPLAVCVVTTEPDIFKFFIAPTLIRT